MLFRLLYRAKANYPPFTFHDLEILRSSITFNSANGISGYLIRGEYEYFQILEGDPDTVKLLAKKIARDGRIYGYSGIWSGSVEGRLFGHWYMGFHMLSQLDDGLPDRLINLTPATPPPIAQQMIREIAQMALEKQERAADGSP